MFSKWKKGGKSDDASAGTVDLDLVITLFGQGIETWGSQSSSRILARARFGDICRLSELPSVKEEVFNRSWDLFDDAAQQRFGLVLSGFQLEEPRAALTQLRSAEAGLQRLGGLAIEHKWLTMDVLEQSDIRLEELSRHFCALWTLVIEGETAEASAKRLRDIDFGRLMEEANQAKSSAEDRMAYLRKLQEEQEETRRPRRGKW